MLPKQSSVLHTVECDVSCLPGHILHDIVMFGLGHLYPLSFTGLITRYLDVAALFFQHDLADIASFSAEIVPGPLLRGPSILTKDDDLVCQRQVLRYRNISTMRKIVSKCSLTGMGNQ